jgi:hypothetical protein
MFKKVIDAMPKNTPTIDKNSGAVAKLDKWIKEQFGDSVSAVYTYQMSGGGDGASGCLEFWRAHVSLPAAVSVSYENGMNGFAGLRGGHWGGHSPTQEGAANRAAFEGLLALSNDDEED